MRTITLLLAGTLFLSSSSWGSSLISSEPPGADDELSQIEIILQRDQDSLEINLSNEEAIVVLHSERGIGRMTVNRTGSDWPDKMIFHLHLADLEGLTLETATQRLHTFLGTNQTEVRTLNEETGQWEEGEEHDFNIVVHRDESLGVITAELPASLLDVDLQTFQLQWVDFYR